MQSEADVSSRAVSYSVAKRGSKNYVRQTERYVAMDVTKLRGTLVSLQEFIQSLKSNAKVVSPTKR